MEPKTFAARLAVLVKLVGSEKALSRGCGLSHSAVTNMRAANSCDFETLTCLRIATGINLTWLITGDESPGSIHAPSDDDTAKAVAFKQARPPRKPKPAKAKKEYKAGGTRTRSSKTHG